MEKISYKLEVFEGPMDLLLHLISKHKLNINDIPIFELVEQYISYVRQMQESDMGVASEFLEMTARLVYIKTVSLLPVHEEAEALKSELTGELLEYRDCQLMAGKLSENALGFELFPKPPQEFEKYTSYNCLHEMQELLLAYISAVGKGQRKLPPPVESFTNLISTKIVSVSSKILFVLRRVLKNNSQKVNSLFESSESRSDMVAIFLAVLELLKAKRVTVNGEGDEMFIELSEGAEVLERN
ncbi:MAG: segregation/condensation protein A [Oscillospiraceae bacterium]